jgi:1,2-diacylglycerol 3-beta-galactosyltransferase
MLSPRAWSTWYFRGCALQLRPRAASWALGFLSTSQMALLALAVVVLVAYSLWRCLGDGRSGLMPLPEEVAGSSSGSGKDSKLPAMGEASPLLPAGGTSGGALAAPWLPSAPVGGSVAPPLYPEAKRVLVLMSATGGGHLTSAQAISTALRQLFGDERVQIEILDIWAKYASWPFTGIVNHYKIFSRHPWLWKLSYDFTQFPVTRLLSEAISDITSFAAFRRAIFERDPDLVLSVHPLCQSMPVRIVAELNRCRYQRDPRCRRLPVVFATCITDLISCHDCWFHPAADIIFAPTDEVRRLGLSNGSGLLDRRLRVHGLPIRPVFWTPSNLSRKEVREKLGLDPQRRTVLVVGGGDGMGSVREQADAIVRRLGGPDILSGTQQVVVICGTNEALRAQLVSMRDSGTWSGDVAVMILGFTRAMDEFMLAADLLVTKAGPGTICEAMIVGLPMVLSSFLPGQETGNVTYVVDNQLGYFEAEPRRIADRVAQLLVDDALLQEMASRARTLANPQVNSILFYSFSPLSPSPSLASIPVVFPLPLPGAVSPPLCCHRPCSLFIPLSPLLSSLDNPPGHPCHR